MKVLLDTCVLYPTVMREMLLGVAGQGAFTPLWSERILEEWARAARKLGPGGEAQARAEVAQVSAQWPGAAVLAQPGLEARLWLPDRNDVHVLAAAIAGHADIIVTLNNSDFPRNILAEEGLTCRRARTGRGAPVVGRRLGHPAADEKGAAAKGGQGAGGLGRQAPVRLVAFDGCDAVLGGRVRHQPCGHDARAGIGQRLKLFEQ